MQMSSKKGGGSQGGLLTVGRSWRSQFRTARGESTLLYLVNEYFSGKWERLEREQVTAGCICEEVWENKGPSRCVTTKARHDT